VIFSATSDPIINPAGPTHAGTLALVGSGEYLPSMEPVDRWLLDRLNEPPRVVCLPTAAGTEGAARLRYWMKLGVEHFQRLGCRVTALPLSDRAGAQSTEFAQEIQAANYIYFSGGKPDYLMNVLEETIVWKAVLAVLDRGGVVAGCSAGAMIMGDWLMRYPVPGIGRAGFGVLPGSVIIPHFDELPALFIQALRLLIGHAGSLYGIEGNTALIARADRLQVIGTGQVHIISHA
jgi:cyanophycinase